MIGALRSPRFYDAAALRAFDGYLSAQAFRPEMLGLRALYDHRASFAGGMRDLSGNGLADATVGAGSNSPLWLPYNRPSVYLPPSNLLRTTDAPQLRWSSGNIQLTATFTPFASSVSADIYLIIKGSAYGTREYSLRLRTTGVLSWFGRDSGGGSVDTNSAAAVTLTPGVPITLRLTVDPGTGVRTFEQSSDGISFTTVGAPIAGAPFTPIAATGDLFAAYAGDPGSIRMHAASVALNNATVAAFDADQCAQTGHADAYGKVWILQRSATGRTAVVQSPSARSANGVWSFGTDDWIDVPSAAVPALNTFGPATTFLIVYRQWHNGSVNSAVFSTKADALTVTLGTLVRTSPSAGASGLTFISADGTVSDSCTLVVPFGQRAVVTHAIGDAAPFLSGRVNNGAAAVDNTRATTITTSTGGASRLGANLNGASPISGMEFEALLTADRALSAAEVAQIVAFYQGGM